MVRLEQLKVDAMDMIIGIQGVPWSIGSWYTCGWLYYHIRGHLLGCYEPRFPTPQEVIMSSMMPTLRFVVAIFNNMFYNTCWSSKCFLYV